ncbi:hypothetical protein BST61_g3471 [Cercospora zeina]
MLRHTAWLQSQCLLMFPEENTSAQEKPWKRSRRWSEQHGMDISDMRPSQKRPVQFSLEDSVKTFST